jgi:hypothetical protein
LMWFLGGILAAVAVVFWPPGVLNSYLLYSTTGPSVGLNFGGFWVWSLAGLPGFGSAKAWLYANSSVVFLVCTALATVVALAVAARLALTKVVGLVRAEFVAACVLGFVAIYLVTPTVQPQYLIWILPFLLLAFAWDRRFLIPFLTASTLPVVFYLLGLGGPGYLFQGLALYTHTFSTGQIVASIQAFYPYGGEIALLTTVPTFLALLYGFLLSLEPRVREASS